MGKKAFACICPVSVRLNSDPSPDRSVQNLRKLCRWFADHDRVLVAFSGGVDSSVLAAAAFRSLGQRAVAVTVGSELQSEADLENAWRTASEIWIEHIVLEIGLLEVGEIRANGPKRCYLCKKAMAERLWEEAKSRGIVTVVDGTNASDKVEDRPGMRALLECDIRTPLRELGIAKPEVRVMAKQLGLSNADRPSRSCLATKIRGTLTAERLKRVEEAEGILDQGWKIADRGDRVEVRVPAGAALSGEMVAGLRRIGYRRVVVTRKSSLRSDLP